MSLDEPITNKEKRQSVKKNIARTYFDALANLLGYAEGKKDLHDYSHQQRIELAQGLKEFYLGVIRESVHVTESVEKRLEKISGRVAEFSKQLGKNKIVFNGLEDAASYLKREYASFDKGQGVAAKGRPD